MCVECDAIDALIVRPRRCTFLQFMFSITQGTGLFAPAFCMSMVLLAAFETSADRHTVIKVAYRPLKFDFFCSSFLRIFFTFLLVLNVNVVWMSPSCRFRPGFWASIMSSAFSVVTASDTLYIISFGSLLFWTFPSTCSLNFPRICVFNNSFSSLLSASILEDFECYYSNFHVHCNYFCS